MLLDRLYSYVANPPLIASVVDWLLAVAFLLLPWVLLLWLVAWLLARFWSRRAQFGVEVAVRLAYAWAALIVASLFLVDGILLLILTRVPNWTAVIPHLTFILLSLLVLFRCRSRVKGDLRASRSPLRVAQQGGRS